MPGTIEAVEIPPIQERSGSMARRIVDLSQPLSRESQVHPFFGSAQILRQMIHADVGDPDRPSFNAETLIFSNHTATHVDAFGHYDSRPDAESIAEMDLGLFCGPAVAIDVRPYGTRGHWVTPDEAQDALARGGTELREGDALLFCTDHYNLTAGTPAFLDGFSGVAPETVAWMADRGVRIFGTETISPDLVYATDDYRTHRACIQHRITHYENLNNLTQVLGRRFDFYGFPLRLEVAYGSPVRAVAILDE
jgi:kynurenine formamidase